MIVDDEQFRQSNFIELLLLLLLFAAAAAAA